MFSLCMPRPRDAPPCGGNLAPAAEYVATAFGYAFKLADYS